MKRLVRLSVGASLLAGVMLSPSRGHAYPASYQSVAEPTARSPHRSLSAFDYVPFYALPGRFLFSGNYYTHLNITELRIDHVSNDSHCTRGNRVFMISAGYLAPIGNRLGAGQVEIPFLSADSFQVSRLAPASVGDYVVHLSQSKDYIYSAAAEMFLTARF